MNLLTRITAENFNFPDAECALRVPDGLLAVGGDLAPERLIAAYQNGIFPWYNEGQPILWWSPDPRAVLFPQRLHVSRSLRKVIRKEIYTVSYDQAFRAVMEGCAAPRALADGTWISPAMRNAYCTLHELGIAHSIEAWRDGVLAGGLYGVALGKVFFGESMFSRSPNASKVAFVRLTERLHEWDYRLIDCQMPSEHLLRFGAELIPRKRFIELVKTWDTPPDRCGLWR